MATFSVTGIQQDPDNQFITTFIANEAIAAGEVVYLDTDGEANVADNTDSGKITIVGIALQAADALNQCTVITDGVIQVSNVLVIGDSYILSTTGDLQLATDLASTEFLSAFGAATTTGKITLGIKNYGAQKA